MASGVICDRLIARSGIPSQFDRAGYVVLIVNNMDKKQCKLLPRLAYGGLVVDAEQ